MFCSFVIFNGEFETIDSFQLVDTLQSVSFSKQHEKTIPVARSSYSLIKTHPSQKFQTCQQSQVVNQSTIYKSLVLHRIHPLTTDPSAAAVTITLRIWVGCTPTDNSCQSLCRTGRQNNLDGTMIVTKVSK